MNYELGMMRKVIVFLAGFLCSCSHGADGIEAALKQAGASVLQVDCTYIVAPQ